MVVFPPAGLLGQGLRPRTNRQAECLLAAVFGLTVKDGPEKYIGALYTGRGAEGIECHPGLWLGVWLLHTAQLYRPILLQSLRKDAFFF